MQTTVEVWDLGGTGDREMATEKQINYALALLDKNGYDIRYMDASYKRLGATMRERNGTVRNWLAEMERPRISNLIDTLKG